MDKRKHKLFEAANGKNYLLPFVLVTTLFFLWGFAHSILDVLNKHFQESMNISKAESALVQAVVYGGYFLMAIPAGRIIRRFGYRSGVLTGLTLYGIGALLFIPGGMFTILQWTGMDIRSACRWTVPFLGRRGGRYLNSVRHYRNRCNPCSLHLLSYKTT